MSTSPTIQDSRVALSLTISSGTALSSAIELQGYQPVSLIIPGSTWSSAAIAFVACDTPGGTYLPVYSDTAEVSLSSALTKGGARAFAFRGDYAHVLGGFSYLKIHSGAGGSTVNQAKDVAMTLIVAPLA